MKNTYMDADYLYMINIHSLRIDHLDFGTPVFLCVAFFFVQPMTLGALAL